MFDTIAVFIIQMRGINNYFSPTSVKLEDNINETASLIVRLYLLQLGDYCYFNIYGPCVLLPVDKYEYFGKL